MYISLAVLPRWGLEGDAVSTVLLVAESGEQLALPESLVPGWVLAGDPWGPLAPLDTMVSRIRRKSGGTAMIELDIRGQVCPDATGSVFTAVRRLPDGETLAVTSDYAPARSTIPALVSQMGATWTMRDLDGEEFIVEITRPGASANPQEPVVSSGQGGTT